MSHNEEYIRDCKSNANDFVMHFVDDDAFSSLGSEGLKRPRAWSDLSDKSSLYQGLNTSLQNALGQKRLNDLKVNWSAVIAMNVFAVSTTGQAAMFKLLSEQGVSILEYQVTRYFAMFAVAAFQVWQQGIVTSQVFSYEKKGTLLFRVLSGQACFFLINLSLTMLPVFVYTVLFQTSSFWISIMGFFINREKINPVELVGMVICFICVTLIAFAGSQGGADMAEVAIPDTSFAGVLAALSASIVYASSCISNRTLGDLPYQLIAYWGCLIGIPLWSAIYFTDSFVQGTSIDFFSHSATTYWMLVGALTFDVVAANAMTIAFQSGASGFVCLIGYGAIVYSFLSDLIIFESVFSALEVVASLAIVATVIAVTVYKVKLAERQQSISDTPN